MPATVHILQPPQAMAVWEQIAPFLHKPLERTRKLHQYPVAYLRQLVASGGATIWTIMEDEQLLAVAMTQFRGYPGGGRVCDIFLISGEKMADWAEMAYNAIKDFARLNGCSEICGGGRLGWAKMVQRFEPEHSVDTYITVPI